MINKKGVSAVISAIILIAIVLVVVGIVMVVVVPMVEDRVNYTEACSPEILDKIEINSLTCYKEGEIKVYINIKDVETDKILVSVDIEGESKSFEVEQGKNSGIKHTRHLVDELRFSSAREPDAIRIAPIIDGEQCNEIDSLYNFRECDENDA
jgi:flagellin-like protein